MRWDISRFDKVVRTSRMIIFGSVILFIATMDPDKLLSVNRLNILIYTVILGILVNSGRLLIIFIEKKWAVLEYAPHHTLLVGSSVKARNILKEIEKNPHLLYDVIGIVASSPPDSKIDILPYLGNYKKIPAIIREKGIEEVIIAIEGQSPDEILKIVAYGENMRVSFKVIPEMYDVISGLKTEEILGHPLIKLFPEHMLPWQWILKRFMDFIIAGLGLIVLSPIFLVIVLFQMLAGIRPIFTIEDRVGRNGKIFGLVQFNIGQKEKMIGKYLEAMRLNNIPQLLNVMMGSLSLVGPRPETKQTVEKLCTRIRFYNRRFIIRPGMTGWAQLKVTGSSSAVIKEEHFRQDIFYLENMSLIFDIRIIVRIFLKFLFRR
jgi:lipopolysaccharide/colanic/teichoic acid biosynthesis glycosyltransferase